MRNRIPEADLSDGSDYDLLSRMVAALFQGNQAGALYILRQIFPSTSEGDFLRLHAELRGLAKAPAAKATGTVILRGSADGLVQPLGSGLTHGSGATYETLDVGVTATSPATGKTCSFDCSRDRLFVLPDLVDLSVGDVVTVNGETVAIRALVPSAGAVDIFPRLTSAPSNGTAINAVSGVIVAVEAVEAGAAGNRDGSDSVTVDAPATSGADTVTATATVAEISGGGDEETDAELQERIRAFMSLRPASGNVAHFRAWAREVEGVRLADAFVYPNYRGLGAIDVVPFGVTGARITSDAANESIRTAVEAEAGFADDVNVRAVTPASTATAVDLTLTPLTNFGPDWTGAFVVGGGTSTVSRVYLTTDAVGTVDPGARVLIPIVVNGLDRLKMRTATPGTSGGLFWLDLDEDLEAVPSNGVSVRPGSPVAQGVIDAVESLFDGLGPGDTSSGTRYPSPSEAYPATLRRTRLTREIQGVTGVDTLSIVAPATDQTPATFERLVLGPLSISHV
ncbi:MAG: baseplate J/gp47 family protein [Sandaracinaceae bacterium]